MSEYHLGTWVHLQVGDRVVCGGRLGTVRKIKYKPQQATPEFFSVYGARVKFDLEREPLWVPLELCAPVSP